MRARRGQMFQESEIAPAIVPKGTTGVKVFRVKAE